MKELYLGFNVATVALDVAATAVVSTPETSVEAKIFAGTAAIVFTFVAAAADAFILTRIAISRRGS